MNLGKLCNQACAHCHVDAGPTRQEIMTRATMEQCLEAIRGTSVKTVDITGGAPEMVPHFRWLVSEVRKLGCDVIVRCNLTILVANPTYFDLPYFYAEKDVHVIASLPCYGEENTDEQRGDGVYARSIAALKRLNAVGYGREGSNRKLDLVYNPVGAFLPGPQEKLERDFKRELATRHGIQFHRLLAITNMPIARFRDALEKSGEYETYLEKLAQAFNPAAARGVMCRNTLSVSWDGYLYDCDFNQMLDMKIGHLSDLDWEALSSRAIRLGRHCFGCTAGAGSSCTGEINRGAKA